MKTSSCDAQLARMEIGRGRSRGIVSENVWRQIVPGNVSGDLSRGICSVRNIWGIYGMSGCRMEDYKSLRAAVDFATLVNTQTHIHRELLTSQQSY